MIQFIAVYADIDTISTVLITAENSEHAYTKFDVYLTQHGIDVRDEQLIRIRPIKNLEIL